jgi:dTDP-glucose 4,6-dehydratase
MAGEPLPVYGDGGNIRDWLHVADHCAALVRVLEAGRVGDTYNIGGNAERTNIDLVREICRILDARMPRADASPHESLITFVADRPGHDRRYAIDARKMRDELGWAPSVSLEQGLVRTLDWYLANPEWVGRVRSGQYRGERLGLRP